MFVLSSSSVINQIPELLDLSEGTLWLESTALAFQGFLNAVPGLVPRD